MEDGTLDTMIGAFEVMLQIRKKSAGNVGDNLRNKLDDFAERFPTQGTFSFHQEDSLRRESQGTVGRHGVYLIYGVSGGQFELLYIGRSGTVTQEGKVGKQDLHGRINNKQNGVDRQRFFKLKLRAEKLDALIFDWFATFDDKMKTLPSYAEADLLQAFFDENGCLPRWNKKF